MHCELNNVEQRITNLVNPYSTIKLVGKRDEYLEIKIKTKLITLQDKIKPFFTYISLSFITLNGHAGPKSWCQSFVEAKKRWDKGNRVDFLKININSSNADKVMALWDRVYSKRVIHDKETPYFFKLFDNVNDANRLVEAVSKLVDAAPTHSRVFFLQLQESPAENRTALAEASLPLVQAVKHLWVNGWHGNDIIGALSNVPLEEIDSVATAALPLIQEGHTKSERFIFLLRLTPQKERVNVSNGTLEIARAGNFRADKVIKVMELICMVPEEYRPKFIQFATQFVQINRNLYYLEDIAKKFKNASAVKVADIIIDALSKVPVRKSEFLDDALLFIGKAFFFYTDEPNVIIYDSFDESIDELVNRYS